MPIWIEAVLGLAAVALCTVACWREDRLAAWEDRIAQKNQTQKGQLGMEMKTYYVTLCHELVGYCLRAQAPSKTALTSYLNQHYGLAWCSIMSAPAGQVIGQTIVLDEWGD